MNDIIKERYPVESWNIFTNQISDGDNFGFDNAAVLDLMENAILPKCQYFTYVEVRNPMWGTEPSDLWPEYERLASNHPNMVTSMVTDISEIYPTFRGLFEKRVNKA